MAKAKAKNVAEVGGKPAEAAEAAGKAPAAEKPKGKMVDGVLIPEDQLDAYDRHYHPLVGSKEKIEVEVKNDETGKMEKRQVTIYPFRQAPEDFDISDHRPLKKEDFANEPAYYRHKADLALDQHKKYLRKDDESEKLGSGEQRKAKAKIKRLAEQLMAQKKLLMDQEGMSEDEVNELLALAGGGGAEEAAE